MTGEVTLQGRVLPIGGVKQKVLAAHAAGLTDVILPERNRGDLDDVPEEVREAMSFHFAMTIDEVLERALEPARRMSRTLQPLSARSRAEVRQTADLLERRWQLSIIYAALTGALRFNEFAEAVAGISPRMLSERRAASRAPASCSAPSYPRAADRRVPADRARPQARPDHRSDARLRRRTCRLSRAGPPLAGSRRRCPSSPRRAGRRHSFAHGSPLAACADCGFPPRRRARRARPAPPRPPCPDGKVQRGAFRGDRHGVRLGGGHPWTSGRPSGRRLASRRPPRCAAAL